MLAASHCRSRLPLRPDAFQDRACWLVTRVLWHEFTLKRLGEDSSVQVINQLAGFGRFQCKAINPFESCANTLDYFCALLRRRHWNEIALQIGKVNMLETRANSNHLLLH